MPTMTQITHEDSILRTFVLFMQAAQVRVILDVERGGRKEFARAVMPRNDSANQDGGGTMTSQGPNWRDSLRKSTPEILDRVTALQESTTKDGGNLYRAIVRYEADLTIAYSDTQSPGPSDSVGIRVPNILTVLPEVSAPQQDSGN